MAQPPSKPKPAFKPHSSSAAATAASPNPSSSTTSHAAMVELKQRVLTLLTKLADRDTHHFAAAELQTSFVPSLTQASLPLFLNSLFSFDTASSSFKKDSLQLISLACSLHTSLCSPHLPRIIAFIVNKRLKDPASSGDSSVRDACKDAVASLAGLYLKSESSVGVFVRPLIEAMGDQNKGVQMGAAICLGKVVENAAAGEEVVRELQKGVFGKVVKLVNSPSFLGKKALLPIVGNLAQVGAINPQSLDSLLQGIHECLGSSDWATRKAAAEALSALASHSRDLIEDSAASTIMVLEGCRFDKIKPARDSIMEALQLWKNVAENGDIANKNPYSNDENNQLKKNEKNDQKNQGRHVSKEPSAKSMSTDDSAAKTKDSSIPEKAVVILKKKAPALSDKELNPEFFQKLERRNSVEVVVPRRFQKSAEENHEVEVGTDPKELSDQLDHDQSADMNGSSRLRDNNTNPSRGLGEAVTGRGSKSRALTDDDRTDQSQRESCSTHAAYARSEWQTDGSFSSNKGNWIAIQRQLLQLERQQAHLMSMLQEYMGGSHDGMVTLENRVRGLERVVEEMVQNLSISSARRGASYALGFDGSSGRKFNGFGDFSNSKSGRSCGDGRGSLGERFSQTEGSASSMRGRIAPWRSDVSEDLDVPPFGSSRNGQAGFRRGLNGASLDGRFAWPEHEGDIAGGRKAWDKGPIPVRHGEGPSARSVWQASKDEATLEAIRVAGDDGGNSRMARVAIPERIPEAMGEDNAGREQDPVWTTWTNAMDALQVGDSDSAYAEVLSTGDDFLLVKLMDRTGPVIDQLTAEVASELFRAISQFLPDQNLTEVSLSWVQQLLELELDAGANAVDLPLEIKKEVLLSLHELSSAADPSEDWEGGATPDQLLLQLASSWGIDL
ncbi:hypothetical protein MLD38_000685 [Melastoma candidum]|uniref:Uncharacterized protein n=1 Tax=Melastoma candidum TaxID=119954 RepID=A0ACB9SA62_9MYRT|nr:hypothetical protein MLD38_000685 [Melastoma candidum]